MISIYVETNYILELAFSQEQAQSCLHLLEIHERGAGRLVIPAFSIGECFDTLVRRSAQRKHFAETVSVELKQLSRSLAYRSEVPALDSITRLLINSLEDDKRRLDEILTRVLEVAEIVPLNQSAQIARETGLSRESLYKALSGDRSPGFDTILKVVSTLLIVGRLLRPAELWQRRKAATAGMAQDLDST